MQEEMWLASPEPAVGVFTPAGTCPGRIRQHCVIGYANPGQNPSCRQVWPLSGSGKRAAANPM